MSIQITSPKQCCELLTKLAAEYDDNLMNVPENHPVIQATRKYFKEHPDPIELLPPKAYDNALRRIKPLWEQGLCDQDIAVKIGITPSSVCMYRKKWGKPNKRAWKIEHDGQCDIMNSVREFQDFMDVSHYISSQRLVRAATKRGYKVTPFMSHDY